LSCFMSAKRSGLVLVGGTSMISYISSAPFGHGSGTASP
jgi:hypothetical protein